MRKGLYLRLAYLNIKNHSETYIPYMFSGAGCIAFLYIMLFLLASPDTPNIRGGSTVRSLLSIGLGVMGVFSLIFLLYSNSFVMKRRQTEFGLYNILGMEKRHISQMLLAETLITGAASLSAGILAGIVSSKLALLLLLKLLHIPAGFGFYVTWEGVQICAGYYGIVLAIAQVWNMGKVHLSRPVELLAGSSTGEREPKSKWLMGLLGFICLGIGYYLAVTTDSILSAFGIFFVAVMLVMAGTYLTFTTGSIIMLKMMRWNKKFYYKIQNFISVSGMLYRMKQNAVGLASICILSTGVLLMVSASVCLNAGIDETVRTSWPDDMNVKFYGSSLAGAYQDSDYILQKSLEEKFPISEYKRNISLSLMMAWNGDNLELTGSDSEITLSDIVGVTLIPEKIYMENFGQNEKLRDGEALAYGFNSKTVRLMGEEFQIIDNLEKEPLSESFLMNELDDSCYLVTTDADFECMNQKQAELASSFYPVLTEMGINIKGSEQTKSACSNILHESLKEYTDSGRISEGSYYIYKSQAQAKADYYDLNGGLLFLGILLGGAFLMGTALIIYYKQISEGYEDRKRFSIMRRVGMSRKEVKSSIGRQILMVFFLPLLMAALHMAMAFPLMRTLLLALGMPSGILYLICTVGTVMVFALIYGVIYIFTARVYYNILGRTE